MTLPKPLPLSLHLEGDTTSPSLRKPGLRDGNHSNFLLPPPEMACYLIGVSLSQLALPRAPSLMPSRAWDLSEVCPRTALAHWARSLCRQDMCSGSRGLHYVPSRWPCGPFPWAQCRPYPQARGMVKSKAFTRAGRRWVTLNVWIGVSTWAHLIPQGAHGARAERLATGTALPMRPHLQQNSKHLRILLGSGLLS